MNKIKNTVVELKNGNRRTVYVSIKNRPELLASLHHKLRVKSAIHGCTVVAYCPEMNFDNAIKNGSMIVIDKRDSYVHDVRIVPTYTKKSKKDKKCPLCGK